MRWRRGGYIIHYLAVAQYYRNNDQVIVAFKRCIHINVLLIVFFFL